MNVKFFINIYQQRHILIYGYLVAMLSVFLFYVQDYYFNLTSAKYDYFAFATLLLMSGGMLLTCIMFITKEYNMHTVRKTIHAFSITDWAFLILLVSQIITTLLSAYPYESITGSSGRQTGLLFSFLITSMYFLVSRWYKQENSIILLYLCSVMIVITLGVLNFYGIDPFHFFDYISESDVPRYLSTLGNIQFFAHVICLSLPMSIILLSYVQDIKKKVMYSCFVIFGCIGLYIANIDGAYLGIGAFLLFFFYMSLSNYNTLKNALGTFLLILFSGKIVSLVSVFLHRGRGFTTISLFVTSSPCMTALCISILILYLCVIRYRDKVQKFNFNKIKKWYLLFLSFSIVVLFSFITYINLNPDIEVGSLGTYIRFNDEWGTGRGWTWNSLISCYIKEFSLLQKMFGYGLDCIRILMVNTFETSDIMFYDNAHNEYLQYLVTSGLFGLISYLVLFFSIQLRLYKHRFEDPRILAILGCMIAHGAQAITGLNQPITTPIFFILIALGENFLRNRSTYQAEENTLEKNKQIS